MAVILVVDDDKTQRMLVSQALVKNSTYTTEEAKDGLEALARLMDTTKPAVDLVLLDLVMPQMDGRELMGRIRMAYPHMPVIIMTGNGEAESVVALMRLGASDFIVKPLSRERLRLSVEQHLTIRTLSSEVARLKRKEDGSLQFDDLIGAHNGLAPCIALARKAAGSDIPVLITGASGTGKELLSRAIHGESPRARSTFVAINCGAIPEHLVESTLFGHEKGSFTGAIAREIGKFREAEGGTLFLDEVGELKPDMQTKLLRVLQQKEIQPVGAGGPIKVNVRILSATNRNLAHEVSEGRFRSDLYYRLNVLPIYIPTLSEHSEDIPLLAQHMLTRFVASEQKPSLTISEGGMAWLMRQRWGGNIRELENLLYRCVVLSDKTVLDADDFTTLSQELQHGTPSHYMTLLDAAGQPKSFEAIESEVIASTLQRLGGNISETARVLGMGQSTLYKKLSGKAA